MMAGTAALVVVLTAAQVEVAQAAAQAGTTEAADIRERARAGG